MNTKRILIASLVVWIVSTAFGWLTCGWLFNWVYTLPPNIWQPEEVMATGLIWMALLGILIAAIFVTVYAVLFKGIPGKGVNKGLTYGSLIWLVSGFSGMITMPFYMTIATTVVVYWIMNFLVISLINGAIVGAIYGEK
jgi:hypothetical protein